MVATALKPSANNQSHASACTSARLHARSLSDQPELVIAILIILMSCRLSLPTFLSKTPTAVLPQRCNQRAWAPPFCPPFCPPSSGPEREDSNGSDRVLSSKQTTIIPAERTPRSRFPCALASPALSLPLFPSSLQ